MLNEFRSTLITWDKATSRIYSPVTANASDENGRKLVVQIVNSGQVEDLTGATLHLYWETRDKAHDGLDVFKVVDLEKGEFELSYTTGMLTNQGVLNANLVLIDTVGRVVSERFKITVTEGIDNDAIQSENSFSSLTKALIDISNLEQNYAPRLNDLTAQLQQAEQSLNAQLAQTASQSELNAVSSNVANIIAHNGDGTKDTEIVALRTDNKGLTYPIASDRVTAIENTIDENVSAPPIIKSVPAIRDVLDLETGVFTQNVGEVIITGSMYAGILTDKTNYDYVYTTVIAGAKTPAIPIPSGMTEYKNKNGVILEETANSNLTSDVGKYTLTDTGRIWIYVPKGTYTTIADARLGLGTTVLRYQLETPVTSVKRVGSITKELVRIRENNDGDIFDEASERINDIENNVNNFTRYLSPSFVAPPEIKSVPAISDTYVDSILTKNVEQVTISGSKIMGIITTETNYDAVYTEVLPFSKFGTGGISGRTVLIDKNFNTMVETDSVDEASNVGKYSHRVNGRIWLHVPKGKYLTVEEARNDLGILSLRYQLETPVVSHIHSGFVCDLSGIRDFSIKVTQTTPTPIAFVNVPEKENIILAVTLNIQNSVAVDLIYPAGTVWKGGRTPILAIGKTHMLFFMSYDNGTTWLASVTGEW